MIAVLMRPKGIKDGQLLLLMMNADWREELDAGRCETCLLHAEGPDAFLDPR